MKDKLYEMLTEIVGERDYWLNIIRNANIFKYHEKYKYSIVYFHVYHKKLFTSKIIFENYNWGMLFRICAFNETSNIQPTPSQIQTTTTFEIAKKFDQTILFMYNRQLKIQTLMDFI